MYSYETCALNGVRCLMARSYVQPSPKRWAAGERRGDCFLLRLTVAGPLHMVWRRTSSIWQMAGMIPFIPWQDLDLEAG